MKRSELITDFGLADGQKLALVLVSLTKEPGSCEKLMNARRERTTPAHPHRKMKEDLICRWGTLAMQEASTANDDLPDNFFVSPEIGRYPGIGEDEPTTVRLIGRKSQ